MTWMPRCCRRCSCRAIQFGFVISFHILFPAFTIGLAHWLAFLEWRWLRTRDDAVARPVFLLAEDLRGVVRHGRGVAASS